MTAKRAGPIDGDNRSDGFERWLGSTRPIPRPSEDEQIMLALAYHGGRAEAIAALSPFVREDLEATEALARLSVSVHAAVERIARGEWP